PGKADDVGEQYGQELLTAAGARLDAARYQRANERCRYVFLERGEASAHLRQRGRKIVELAQWRTHPGNRVELETFDVLQLADDAKQRRTDQPVSRQDGRARDGERQQPENREQQLCVALYRRQEVTGRNDRSH